METVEEKSGLDVPSHGLVSEATLHLLSIAVGSNIPGSKSKCWIRKSSDPKDAQKMIKCLVLYPKKLQVQREKLLPAYLFEVKEKIESVF